MCFESGQQCRCCEELRGVEDRTRVPDCKKRDLYQKDIIMKCRSLEKGARMEMRDSVGRECFGPGPIVFFIIASVYLLTSWARHRNDTLAYRDNYRTCTSIFQIRPHFPARRGGSSQGLYRRQGTVAYGAVASDDSFVDLAAGPKPDQNAERPTRCTVESRVRRTSWCRLRALVQHPSDVNPGLYSQHRALGIV